MTRGERILSILTECGGPVRLKDIVSRLGDPGHQAAQAALRKLMKWGKVRKVGHGLYEAVDNRTLGDVAEIEVKRDVRPVVPEGGRVELKPQRCHQTVSLLLEVIARSDDPKPYAGVVREIGDLLATS